MFKKKTEFKNQINFQERKIYEELKKNYNF